MNNTPNILRRQVGLQAVADYQVPNQDALNTAITDAEGQSRGYKMFGFNRGFKLYPYNGRKYLELRSLERILATKTNKVVVHPKSNGYCAGINFTYESWVKLKELIPIIDQAFEDIDVADLSSSDKAMGNLFKAVEPSEILLPTYTQLNNAIPFEDADTDEYEEEEEDESMHMSENNDKGDQTMSQLADAELSQNGKTIDRHMWSAKNKVRPVQYVQPYPRPSTLMTGGGGGGGIRAGSSRGNHAGPSHVITLD